MKVKDLIQKSLNHTIYIDGKPLIQHSIDKAKLYQKIQKNSIVINKKHKKFIKNLKIKNVKIIRWKKSI